VPDGAAARTPGDEVRYNTIAARLMADEKIAINDLYALANEHLATWQRKANVHFNAQGSRGLGDRVADEIRKALAARAKASAE
jgi:hypothetical protein